MLVLFSSLHLTPGMSWPLCSMQSIVPYIRLQLPLASYLTYCAYAMFVEQSLISGVFSLWVG